MKRILVLTIATLLWFSVVVYAATPTVTQTLTPTAVVTATITQTPTMTPTPMSVSAWRAWYKKMTGLNTGDITTGNGGITSKVDEAGIRAVQEGGSVKAIETRVAIYKLTPTPTPRPVKTIVIIMEDVKK